MEDFIVLYFVHSSILQIKRGDGIKVIWKKLGGHVSMQIDDSVYGFERGKQDKLAHIFPKANKEYFNSKFNKKNVVDWGIETKNDNVTFIKIPVSENQKNFLIETYDTFIKDTPYDYALFGMRCASSMYEILAMAQILPLLKSRNSYVIRAFVPRVFRESMLVYAKTKGIPIYKK